ncbi:MAG: ATP-binding protein [Candidatus Eremiobacterota bacterium]
MGRHRFDVLMLEGSERKRQALERLFRNREADVRFLKNWRSVPCGLREGADLLLWPASGSHCAELQEEARAAGLELPVLYRPSLANAGAYLGHARLGCHKLAAQWMSATGTWWDALQSDARIHERYRKLLNRLQDGYLEVDAQDVIRWANAAVRKAVGPEPPEGRPLEEILVASDVARLRALREQHRQGVVISFPLRLASGKTVEVDPSPRFDPHGHYLGASLVLHAVDGANPSLERGRDLFTLYAVASVLSEAANLCDALHGVLVRMLDLVSLQGAGVFLTGEQGLQLRVLAGLELDRVALAALFDLCAAVRPDQKCRVLRNLQPDDPYGQSLYRAGVRGVAAVPLAHGGERIGVMWVAVQDPDGLSREVVSLLISIAAQMATSVANHRHVEARLEEEATRRRFYRDALLAVTRGKLTLCERPEAEEVWHAAGDVLHSLEVSGPQDVPRSREVVERVLREEGYPEERCYDLALCASEAVANVVKHAERGTMEVRRTPDRVRIKVEDRGPGIDFAHLPDAVLTAGFSTAPSLGMGYSLLLELTDGVHLATNEGGTCLILEVVRQQPDPLAAFAALLED